MDHSRSHVYVVTGDLLGMTSMEAGTGRRSPVGCC